MPGPLDDFITKVASVTGKWTSFAAFGSFFVYFMGYLALRFQLSTYGVATNLDVWDERYLFAGSRCLVYLVAAVPNVLLMVIVLWIVFFLLSRLLPAYLRGRIRQSLEAWASRPNTMPLLGTLLAVALIQFVMKQSFVFGNLLLRQSLPQFGWINGILLTGDGYRSVYFSGLVGGVLSTGAILLFAMRASAVTTPFSKALTGLLVFLVAVQFLLLPVNYGILIASQHLPRVAELQGEEKLASGEQAWLVWDSKEAMMYFKRTADDKRTLVTLPRKETKTSIVGYDAIFRVLFGNAKAGM
ncbi:MAG TPA: hypothetical protein VE077_15090 [Candidatus Methylomirabilis sp.]|nr:hypothetical protein [Candidatus Methylomirabilis sp.]